MGNNELFLFQHLKKEVAQTFLKNNQVENTKIHLWKGQEITLFQEDLFQKVKGSFSEKWFYTYFKSDSPKLPRIDMLNLLAQYSGYNNWADFKQKNSSLVEKRNIHQEKKTSRSILILGILLVFSSLIFLFFNSKTENIFEFCFIDDNTNQIIEDTLEITVLTQNESPFHSHTNEKGCFTWKTVDDHIKIVVQSPYHKIDTIVRRIQETKERIKLKTNDYALMIHYYSTSNVQDWKKRRNHLKKAISEQAIIYQILDNNSGIELYSKEDFINRMTLPTNALKNIQIINTQSKNGQIIQLKFKIQSS